MTKNQKAALNSNHCYTVKLANGGTDAEALEFARSMYPGHDGPQRHMFSDSEIKEGVCRCPDCRTAR